MAFNPIALYSDPVKYKKVLEQGSHLFDQITPNIEFSYSNILAGFRSDILIANAAIEHGPSSKEYQDAKEHFFDEGAEVSIENFHETRNYLEQNLSGLELGKTMVQWDTRVLLPCIGVQGIIKETRALFVEAPVIDNPFQLTAEDVYDLLESINGQTADQLIRLIKCPLMARRQLLDAYRGKDRVTFISVLEDPSNNCDCSDIDKYANTEGVQKTALYYNKINNISKTLEACLPSNQPLEHSQVIMSTLSEYIKDDEIKSRYDNYRFRVENEDSSPISIIFDDIILPDNPKVKELYYYVFDENSEYSAIEREVLESILRRPEGLEIYNEYKAEYEKERLEVQAEEQLEEQNAQQGPVTAPSEDVKKQVAQTKEDSTDASLDGKEDTSQKQFNVPKNYMDLPSYSDMDDYYSAMNPKLSSLGADGMTRVFEMLDTYGFLKGEKDQQLLFYRLTGRCRPIEQGELEPINWISHNGHCKELMYFLKRILPDGDKQKYAKARLFFNKFKKWPDTINITTSQYAEGAKASFRKDLHKINPKVFRYSSKGKDEKKPEKKLEKK